MPSRLRTWSEVVGPVAVIASLIFVGLEVRQNAAATRAAGPVPAAGADPW